MCDPKIFNNVIQKFLNYSNGLYIEAGANNGIDGSNTLFLERELNWSGILIEPSKIAFDQCVLNRSTKNIFARAALVKDDSIDRITGDFDGNLMSSIDGKRLNRQTQTSVKASTLTNILDRVNFSHNIDFFSLDVEGYEIEALKGINFSKYKFKYILIEVNFNSYKLSELLSILEQHDYILYDNITKYNKQDNPSWSEDHNDFLFICK